MSLMWNEIMEQPESLRRCLDANYLKIKEFVRFIKKSELDLICIAARGTSDHAGLFAKYVFEIANGIPISLSAPSVTTVYEGKIKYKNTLMIGISQSGMAEDVIEVMRHGRKQSCITVGITNDCNSPIAKEATYHFSCEAGLEKSVAATKTFLAQMLILSIISAEWADDHAKLEQLFKLPDLVAKTLLTSEEVKTKTERYRYIDECFVLARGVNYAIALETALKIQETSYVRARGYAISDFYHGPFAMLEKGMPVIVFIPKGSIYSHVLEMVAKLKEVGAKMIIISNDDKALELGSTAFRIPDTANDEIAAFLNIVITQQFAC